MNQSPLAQLHAQAGARTTAPEAGSQVITYGDVPAEYEAATTRGLVFGRTTRGRVHVSGADATAFLHRILANDVKGLAVGAIRRNLLLDGKGKVRFDFELEREADEAFVIACPPGTAADLLQALDMYLFTEDVELVDQSADASPLELLGAGAAGILDEALGQEVALEAGHAARPIEGVHVARVPVSGSLGWRIDAGPERTPEIWSKLLAAGAQPGGLAVHDILRVEAGRAEFGRDIDDSVYPQEARLNEAFSLDKGCYIGQEVVAKIDTYGGLNKCLFALAVSHDDPIAPGTRLWREISGEWRDLGVITSWAYSFVLDTGLVLAYIKKRHQETGTEFRVGATDATARIVDMPVREDALAVD